MKKIELFWNILHYFVYKADYKAHLFFNKINPFMLIHKLPFQKRMYVRRGINIQDELNRSFKDPANGLSSIRAGSFMFILSFLIGLTFFCLIGSIHNSSNLSGIFIFIIPLPFIILCYNALLYKDKYLKYFSKFELKSDIWKKRWAGLSFGIILLIIFLLILSFKLMDYSIHNYGFLR